MSLESVIQQLENASIAVELMNNKISTVYLNSNSKLTDGEAWDLIDSEGLRYISDPIETVQSDFISWRMQTVQSTEFQAIANAIGLKNLTMGTAILIAFSKIEDDQSMRNAIDLWNSTIQLTAITQQQIDKLNQLATDSNINIEVQNNGQIAIS